MTDDLLAFLIVGAVCGLFAFMIASVYMTFDLYTTYQKKKEKEKIKLYEEFSKKVREEIIQYYDSTRNKD